MRRLSDIYASRCVLAPVSVAAETLTASAFVDAAGVDEVCFLVSAAALAEGKHITVGVYASDDGSGAGATVCEEATFAASAETAKQPTLITLSHKPKAGEGRYLAVKFKHDAAEALLCVVSASVGTMYRPAANLWAVEG